MRTALLAFALLFASTAFAAPSLQVDVERALRPALRTGLEIVHIQLPQGWANIRHADVSVESALPDRAGQSWVRVTLRGKIPQTGYVRVEVGAAQPVLELTHPLRAGDIIDSAALQPNTRLLRDGEHPLGDPRSVIGRKAARDLAAGESLSASDLIAEVQVPRGTPIRVIAKRGSVSVIAAAVLEKAAVPGEETTARVTDTRMLVAGRLIDRNTVLNEGGL